jgi:hypothetical protein
MGAPTKQERDIRGLMKGCCSASSPGGWVGRANKLTGEINFGAKKKAAYQISLDKRLILKLFLLGSNQGPSD